MRKLNFICAALLMAVAPFSMAKDVIKLIVPTSPGGGTDTLFRAIAKYAEPYLDATIVIQNASGAGGTIGVSELTRAKPDGLTMAGVWMGPITVAPHSMNVTYGMDDYIPVIQIDSAPYVLCVRKDFPADNGKQFIAELKKHPGKYTYGTDGVAGPGQLSVERVFKALGVTARDIPYKGAGETMPALLSRVVDIYSGSVPPAVSMEKSGEAKCLLATSADPVPALPDAMGLKALGIPEKQTMLWHGIIVPKGTPKDKVLKIQQAFEKAADSPEMVAFFKTAGVAKAIETGDVFKQHIQDEYKQMGEMVKILGLDRR